MLRLIYFFPTGEVEGVRWVQVELRIRMAGPLSHMTSFPLTLASHQLTVFHTVEEVLGFPTQSIEEGGYGINKYNLWEGGGGINFVKVDGYMGGGGKSTLLKLIYFLPTGEVDI